MLSAIAGVAGVVLLVLAVLYGRRRGFRRSVGVAGGGLLLLGLSVSGLIDVFAHALAALTFNPIRWLGLGTSVLGLLMLSWAGMLPGRGRAVAASQDAKVAGSGKSGKSSQVTRGRGKPKGGAEDDLAEIEDILRRRGIN